MIEKKKCNQCMNILEIHNFNKDIDKKDGLHTLCKLCKKSNGKLRNEKIKKNKLKKRLESQSFSKNEEWKDLTYNNIYFGETHEVSTYGRIRNKNTKLLMTPNLNYAGYYNTSIKRKRISFARAVVCTFLPNYECKPTVEHIDNNRINNKLYNLKWATHQEQSDYIKSKETRQKIMKYSSQHEIKTEIWQVVQQFPEYQISNYGRIKYPIRKGDKPYKIRISDGGNGQYKKFELNKNGRKFKKLLHRVTAETFIKNPNNYSIVNHIDGNKHNNHISNLEWCTQQQNIKHAFDNNLIPTVKFSQHDIKSKKLIKVWNGQNELFDEIFKEKNKNKKTVMGHILKCCKNECETAYGYCWRYYDYHKNKKLENCNEYTDDIKTYKQILLEKNLKEIQDYLDTNKKIPSSKSKLSIRIQNLRKSNHEYKHLIQIFFEKNKKYFITKEELWIKHYNEVNKYIKLNKKKPYQRDKDIFVRSLGKWIVQQKMNYKKKKCTVYSNIKCKILWEKL